MSIEFRTRPVRGSRAPNPGVLVVIGLAALVGLAVLKPWDSGLTEPLPRPTATPADASTTATPTSDPTAGPTPSDAENWARFDSLLGLMRRAMAGLPVRNAVGLRVITEWEPGLADGEMADGSSVRSLVDGTLVEHWYPAEDVDVDGGSWGREITLEGVSADRPALGIGVTTRAADTPLDVRFWRVAEPGEGPVSLRAMDLPYGSVAGHRLFLAPFEGGPSLVWPAGRYLAEVLLGDRIVGIPFSVPAGPPPVASVPDSLSFAPSEESVRAALASQLRGAFAIDAAGHATVVDARAGPPLDAIGAWLAIAEPASADGALIPLLPVRSAVVIGVILPRGSVLQSASLWSAAPETRPYAANSIVITGTAAPPSVAFSPPGEGTWPAGIYRITARYWDPGYRLQESSWHLNLDAEPSPGSLLLLAAGRWAGLERRWGVLSTPIEPYLTRGVSETAESVIEPRTSASVPEMLRETCPGSAHVDRVSPVIGLRFPDGVVVASARLLRRFADGRSLVVPAQQSVIPSVGLALFAPLPTWPLYWYDGYYDIEVALTADAAASHAPAQAPAYVPLCIGDFAEGSSAFIVRPDSASNAAYDTALAMPGVTMLAP